MAALPSDFELQKLLSAGRTEVEIANMYGVTQQAVSYRMQNMQIARKGPKAPVTSALPWNLASHPDKRRLVNQAPFRGLRYFLQKRMGESLSERAELDLRAFLNRVRDGHVLALIAGDGFKYVPREPQDLDLVIRWPDDIPRNEKTALFVDTETTGDNTGA
ncbi:hypothetical protein ACWDWS_02290 [Streptomyces sp. NPDC003328]